MKIHENRDLEIEFLLFSCQNLLTLLYRKKQRIKMLKELKCEMEIFEMEDPFHGRMKMDEPNKKHDI